jgi:hypothetical protein
MGMGGGGWEGGVEGRIGRSSLLVEEWDGGTRAGTPTRGNKSQMSAIRKLALALNKRLARTAKLLVSKVLNPKP